MVAMLGLLVAVVSGKPNSPMVEGTFEEDAQGINKATQKEKHLKGRGALAGMTKAKDGTAGEEKLDQYEPQPDPEAVKFAEKEKGEEPKEKEVEKADANFKGKKKEAKAIHVQTMKDVVTNVTKMEEEAKGKGKSSGERHSGISFKKRFGIWNNRFTGGGVSSRVTFCSSRVSSGFGARIAAPTVFSIGQIWHGLGGVLRGAGNVVGGGINLVGGILGAIGRIGAGILGSLSTIIGLSTNVASNFIQELNTRKLMSCTIGSGGIKYSYRVYFGQAPGSQENFIYWCRKVAGQPWCSFNGPNPWNKVAIADLDKDLSFGLVTWEHQKYPMFGLVGSGDLGIDGQIYGYGSAGQMPFVLNRLYMHCLIKRDVILNGGSIDRYYLRWNGQSYTQIPTSIASQTNNLVWDIPYWLPPKNRANCWKLSTTSSYPQISYIGNVNPAPIMIPGLASTTLNIRTRMEVPRMWNNYFNVKKLRYKNLPTLTKTVCTIPGACRGGNPDRISRWTTKRWGRRCNCAGR